MSSPRKFLLVKPDYAYYPMGLSYVASTLERSNVAYDYVDCSVEEPDWRRLIGSGEYFAVGSGGLVADFGYLERMFKRIKAADSSIPCIIGGYVARDVNNEILFKHIPVAFAVLGEAEVTLPLLLERIVANENELGDLRGIVYRAGDGSPVRTPSEQRVDLAVLRPRPSFTFFDHSSWPVGSKPIPVITGRGCSGACRFCSPSHRTFKARVFEDIFLDVDFLVNDLKVPMVHFMNEIFFDEQDTMIEFCEEYAKRYNTPFMCLLRMDMDTKVLPHLKAAGCVHIGIGVESGSNKVLKLMNKGTTTTDIRRFVDQARKSGFVSIEGGLMFGNEGETEEDIAATLSIDRELGICCSFGYTIPYPGTAIYQRARNKGLIPDEYKFLQMLPKFYSGTDFVTELLFQKNWFGKPILPNLTEIPDDRFVKVLHNALIHYLKTYGLQNPRLVVRDDKIFLGGFCPSCGTYVEREINLLSPIVKNIGCPNVPIHECNNFFAFHGHIYDIPEIRHYAQSVRESLTKCRQIAILGDNFNIKFLFEYDIFGINMDNVIAMGTHCPERIGDYVYSDNYGNYTPNSKLLSHEEIISMSPEAILIALLLPDCVEQRQKLIDMGYPEERIFLMCPPELLPKPGPAKCKEFASIPTRTSSLKDIAKKMVRKVKKIVRKGP
ncbi:MAG: B12-binding domain-containing radical SAM protein [Desulfomonile tiedjei]|nr:B12-binding domain-containing radical SAM protein [Desulfomonile tiedjei]